MRPAFLRRTERRSVAGVYLLLALFIGVPFVMFLFLAGVAR